MNSAKNFSRVCFVCLSVRVSVPLYFNHCQVDFDTLSFFSFPLYLGMV